jgi:hypothetical protein
MEVQFYQQIIAFDSPHALLTQTIKHIKSILNYVTVGKSLKGQCHEIFDSHFFHQTILPRTLIHRLKPFRTWLHICWKIKIIVWKFQIPRYQWDFQDRIPRCQWDHWIRSWSVNETAGSDLDIFVKDSIVSMRQGKRIQQCHWNRAIRSCDDSETKGLYPAVSMTPRDRTPQCQWDRGIL